MLTDSTRLPFKMEAYGGFARVDGLLRVRNDILTLDFQVKENILGGLLKSRPREVRIPLEEIDSVQFKVGWFSRHFYVRVNDMGYLDDVPSSQHGELKLSIRRSDKAAAKRMESVISLRLSQLRLDPSDRFDNL